MWAIRSATGQNRTVASILQFLKNNWRELPQTMIGLLLGIIMVVVGALILVFGDEKLEAKSGKIAGMMLAFASYRQRLQSGLEV